MMTLPTSTTPLVDSLENYDDVVSWINDTLSLPEENDDITSAHLTELEQEVTQLLTTLDIASEESSTILENTIDDVSRGIPRLGYDLHFMRDGAVSLKNNLADVLRKAKETIPSANDAVLEQLHHLDLVKSRMEAGREALREAESWSTLELEVTSLIAEKTYAKAAERLSEASKSMIVFHNTPEYDPRRNLMVNLQNQLEASLSSALVSAINAQDVAICKEYFSIFSIIQRESEFRNYYYASRRSSVVSLWQTVKLVDCDGSGEDGREHRQTFNDFLSKFYNTFATILNSERAPICSIFPDPRLTLSSFVASTLSVLQPTYSQRLSSLANRKNDVVLTELITALRLTEEFAVTVDKTMEKIKFAASSPMARRPSNAEKPGHVRRRSSRMSISWRPGVNRQGSTSTIGSIQQALAETIEIMEWEQELFQPFLDFQIDYGSLEKRLLEHSLAEISVDDVKNRAQEIDRPRLFRERAVDIFGLAESSMGRCEAFTHGYGAVGLVWALDNFFKSFVELWTSELQSEMTQSNIGTQNVVDNDEDLADLDYTNNDWANIQLCLHMLSSARTISERLSGFETKLRNYLSQVATQFNLARNDPINFSIGPARGENQLLEQSTLNSAELRTLLEGLDNNASRGTQRSSLPHEPLLANGRRSLSVFAQTCQITLQKTILSSLRRHLVSYATQSMWTTTANLRSNEKDLKVPTFSLAPSEIIQKVAEGLLNLPRLFEVYGDDDALSFSLQTLPHLDYEMLKNISEPSITADPIPTQATGGHIRRASMSFTMQTNVIDPEVVSSAWLLSLGHTFLEYVVQEVLPQISSLSTTGAAQLAADLGYLSNIVRALNVEYESLEKWRTYADMNEEEVRMKIKEGDSHLDSIFVEVARLRGFSA